MSAEAATPGKKSNTGIMILGGLILLGLVGGAIYLFTKSGTPEKTTSTTTSGTSNSGLSGLLSGVNLTGLSLF